MASNLAPLELDGNLVNGTTYTFQFKCSNYFCLTDLSRTILNDCVAQAPSFLTSLGVTSPFATNLYNVQFTYEGDGSDVVSDVAGSIVGAVMAVSGDNISFVGAVAASASSVTVTPVQAASIAGMAATNAINTAVSDVGSVAKTVTSQAGGVVNTALAGILPLLIVAVAIILYVLPSFAKSARQLQG